jgi:hypothetical protein
MTGVERQSFQAAMALKYCGGNARHAERVFGWGRDTVQLGLHEQRTGVICLGAQAAFCGSRLREAQHPQVAQALGALAEGHGQQDPTFPRSGFVQQVVQGVRATRPALTPTLYCLIRMCGTERMIREIITILAICCVPALMAFHYTYL